MTNLNNCGENTTLKTEDYNKSGSIYSNDKGDSGLVISTRTNPKKGQAKKFMLIVNKEGKREYISSLYPVETIYKAEYKGKEYLVKVKSKNLSIVAIEGVTK